MKEKLIVANWKQNPLTEKEALALYKKIDTELKKYKTKSIFCVPALFIGALSKYKTKNISLGIQNTSIEDIGAYTGQVSFGQAQKMGVRYCIVGHSEARAQGDTDEIIQKKLVYVLKNKGTPILCVGEKVRDTTHHYFGFIEKQIMIACTGLSKKDIGELIIAYEPLWAIGKNAVRDATPDEFYEIKIFITKVLKEKYRITTIPKIVYGGSVNEKNSTLFLEEGFADGLLVGRASLDAKIFTQIIK